MALRPEAPRERFYSQDSFLHIRPNGGKWRLHELYSPIWRSADGTQEQPHDRQRHTDDRDEDVARQPDQEEHRFLNNEGRYTLQRYPHHDRGERPAVGDPHDQAQRAAADECRAHP